jgi:hypothetical protein
MLAGGEEEEEKLKPCWSLKCKTEKRFSLCFQYSCLLHLLCSGFSFTAKCAIVIYPFSLQMCF